jgi:hypothetical protein
MIIAHARTSKRRIDRGIPSEGGIGSILRQPRLIVVFYVIRLRVEDVENVSHEIVAAVCFPRTLRVVRNRCRRNRIAGLVEYAWPKIPQTQTCRVIGFFDRYPSGSHDVDRFRNVRPEAVRIVKKACVGRSDVGIERQPWFRLIEVGKLDATSYRGATGKRDPSISIKN